MLRITTKDTARGSEVSDPGRGAVKFKRFSPEGLNLYREQNQTNDQGTLLVSVLQGYAAVLALHWNFQKKTDTSLSLNWNCCLTFGFQLFTPKATEKSIYDPGDLYPQSLTCFVDVSEHPVWWTENSPLPDGSRSFCLPRWENSVFDLGGTGGCEMSLWLHTAGASALHVGEHSGTEREELIPKYNFATQKPWDICCNLDCITSEEIS